MSDSNGSSPPREAGTRRGVYPRWVWTGTGLAIVGLVVVSVGLIMGSMSLAGVGLAAIVVGAVLAWRAGVMRDVRSGSVAPEVEAVRSGRVHRGTVPGDMVSNSAAQEESRAADQRRQELLERSHSSPMPALAHGAALVILVMSLVLLCAQWALYPTGRTAQNNALRALGVAVILALCGLRILTTRQPARVAATIAIVAGVVLAVFGPLAPHQEAGVAWTETALGTIIVVAALAALTSRREQVARSDTHPETGSAP